MALNIIRDPDLRPFEFHMLVIVEDADDAGVFARPHLRGDDQGNVNVLLFTWDEIENDPARFAFLEGIVLYGDENQQRRLDYLLEKKTFEVTVTFTVEAWDNVEAVDRLNDDGFGEFEYTIQDAQEV